MKRKTSVSLDETIHRRLSDVAKRERRSVSNLLEFFIERSIVGYQVPELAVSKNGKNGSRR